MQKSAFAVHLRSYLGVLTFNHFVRNSKLRITLSTALRMARRATAIISVSTLLCACTASKPPAPRSDYETVGKYPQRDTDAARRANEAGLQMMTTGDYSGAEAILRDALLKDVMFGPAHNNLGLVYYHQSHLYLAAWEFQYAVKLMPNQPEARNNLGLVLEAGGKLDQAVESYEQALKAEPDNGQFVGNCVRARVRRGESGIEVRQLLEKLIMVDSRPEWIAWAKEQLALMKPVASTRVSE